MHFRSIKLPVLPLKLSLPLVVAWKISCTGTAEHYGQADSPPTDICDAAWAHLANPVHGRRKQLYRHRRYLQNFFQNCSSPPPLLVPTCKASFCYDSLVILASICWLSCAKFRIKCIILCCPGLPETSLAARPRFAVVCLYGIYSRAAVQSADRL